MKNENYEKRYFLITKVHINLSINLLTIPRRSHRYYFIIEIEPRRMWLVFRQVTTNSEI